VKTEFWGQDEWRSSQKTHNLYLTTSDFGRPPAPTRDSPTASQSRHRGTFHLVDFLIMALTREPDPRTKRAFAAWYFQFAAVSTGMKQAQAQIEAIA